MWISETFVLSILSYSHGATCTGLQVGHLPGPCVHVAVCSGEVIFTRGGAGEQTRCFYDTARVTCSDKGAHTLIGSLTTKEVRIFAMQFKSFLKRPNGVSGFALLRILCCLKNLQAVTSEVVRLIKNTVSANMRGLHP